MTSEALKDAIAEVRRLVKMQLPDIPVEDVDVREGADFSGDPSLFVTITTKAPVPPDRIGAKNDLRRHFRDWLANQDEERFPYFRFTTPENEAERASSDVS